jgi:hypothetical protein
MLFKYATSKTDLVGAKDVGLEDEEALVGLDGTLTGKVVCEGCGQPEFWEKLESLGIVD